MNAKESTRLDTIDKRLELFLAGMEKLRVAQLKTDAQIAELRAAQLKTDTQITELRAAQLKTDTQIAELRAAQLKTDAQMMRTDRKLDEVGKQLADIGAVQGEVAEDLFYRNVKYIFQKKGVQFGTVQRNLKKKGVAEYDIVATSEDSILVIEVKNKLSARMVDKFVKKRLPAFRQAFPQFKDRRLSGGIGALVVKDEVGRYAEDAGLYVLTQSNDGGAVLYNKDDFMPKIFG